MRPRLAFALAGALVLSCLPEDTSVERGEVELTIAAGPFAKTLSTSRGLTEITLERIVMLAGASVPDCHSTFYIEHPPPAVAVLDMAKPYTFEHRGINETFCKVNAGFIKVEQKPSRGDGVTEAEYDALYREGVTTLGAMHLVASVKITRRDGSPPVTTRFDFTLSGLQGLQITSTTVPRGDKAAMRFIFDTSQLVSELPGLVDFDRNDDGTITTAELDLARFSSARTESQHLADVVQASWRETPTEVLFPPRP